MTIFQKLSWMVQMGIRDLCGETAHSVGKKEESQLPTTCSLSVLDKALAKSKSALSATATHPLGGIGVVPAKVMCVLEAPSAIEDRTGQPLAGPEGDLLKKMLAAIGLDTAANAYVGYLSPWRAPGSRVLTNVETQEGLDLLKKRIAVVRPQILVAFGMPVARALLNLPLGQARAKHHTFMEIPIFTTFAPNFLLKNETYKKGAWADLKMIQTYLNEKGE